jgi:hypothetical protein
MKYMTKPFEIEAIQWTGDNAEEILEFCGKDEEGPFAQFTALSSGPKLEVWDYLQETWVPCNVEDFIIKGMKGEFYPCDHEIFEAKYELIDVPVVELNETM